MRQRIESASLSLRLLGIEKDVPVITRDLVRHAKPDPDRFLAAAERLGVEISDSVVVGDSVWDLLAARRARALGVGLLSGGYGREELERAGAYRVYNDPGDLLLTGTPWGCGYFMDPPRTLEAGDVVECEIERIGALRNTVRSVRA